MRKFVSLHSFYRIDFFSNNCHIYRVFFLSFNSFSVLSIEPNVYSCYPSTVFPNYIIPKGLIPKGNLRINSIIPFYVVVNISSNISFLKFDQSLCYFLVVVKIHITTCLRDTVCSFLHYLLFWNLWEMDCKMLPWCL